MKIHYHIEPRGNFGDDLNLWFWDEVIPGWREMDPDVTLFGIGTLLQVGRLSKYIDSRILVLGSGVGYGELPALPFPKSWDIRCVRGPMSARSLRIDADKAIIDPAVLLSDFAIFGEIKRSRPIFIPHIASVTRHDWSSVCEVLGIEFISPCLGSKQVIKEIAAAPLVIAESMHAAIIADAFRVPWVPVSISRRFYARKWFDWSESLNLELTVQPLFQWVDFCDKRIPIFRYRRLRFEARKWIEEKFLLRALKTALRDRPRYLSTDEALSQKKDQLWDVLHKTSLDYR